MANKQNIHKITLCAVMIALTCVLTMAVRIPSITKGYINLGDCAVLFSGWLLGPVWGSTAGGIGSAFADILAGYPLYAPATLIIKTTMAFIVSLVPRFNKNNKPSRFNIGFAIGSIIAELFMVAGYYLYEAIIIGIGFVPALAGVPENAVQAAVSVAGSYFFVAIFKKNDKINGIR